MNAFELIAAFIDGERVDPDALKEALATGEGRQYLVDLAALREVTLGAVAGTALDTTADPMTSRAQAGRPLWRHVAAAAGFVIVLGGGFAAGRYTGARPDAPARIANVSNSDRVMPAPQPTSIIKLQPGVDWHEQITRN